MLLCIASAQFVEHALALCPVDVVRDEYELGEVEQVEAHALHELAALDLAQVVALVPLFDELEDARLGQIESVTCNHRLEIATGQGEKARLARHPGRTSVHEACTVFGE